MRGFGVTLLLEHEDLCFPHGQRRHVLHLRCVVEARAASVVPVSLTFPNNSCGAEKPTRNALVAVQEYPGLSNLAGRVGAGTIGDEDLRSRGLR